MLAISSPMYDLLVTSLASYQVPALSGKQFSLSFQDAFTGDPPRLRSDFIEQLKAAVTEKSGEWSTIEERGCPDVTKPGTTLALICSYVNTRTERVGDGTSTTNPTFHSYQEFTFTPIGITLGKLHHEPFGNEPDEEQVSYAWLW